MKAKLQNGFIIIEPSASTKAIAKGEVALSVVLFKAGGYIEGHFIDISISILFKLNILDKVNTVGIEYHLRDLILFLSFEYASLKDLFNLLATSEHLL